MKLPRCCYFVQCTLYQPGAGQKLLLFFPLSNHCFSQCQHSAVFVTAVTEPQQPGWKLPCRLKFSFPPSFCLLCKLLSACTCFLKYQTEIMKLSSLDLNPSISCLCLALCLSPQDRDCKYYGYEIKSA